MIIGSCIPLTTLFKISFNESKIFFTSSFDMLVPIVLESIFANLKISSTYFVGSPNFLPNHLAAGSEADVISSKSSGFNSKISIAFWGGGLYSNPTCSFLCLTSIECDNARIFFSLLQSKILPFPKNSPTKTNSLSKPLNVKYTILSAPICSTFVNLRRKRSLRNLFNNLFDSVCSIFTPLIHNPNVENINITSGFLG